MSTTLVIKVIRDFVGINGKYVETIVRKGTQVRHASKRGVRGSPQPGQYRVSYKGKTHTTFRRPESYGDISGLCITADQEN